MSTNAADHASATDLATAHAQAVEWFRGWLGQLAQRTQHEYRRDLRSFAEFVGSAETVEVFAAQFVSSTYAQATEAVTRYKVYMIDAELTPSTINRRLSAIRSLTKHAHRGAVSDWSITVKGLTAANYRDTRGPGIDGVRAMLATIETAKPKGQRDYLAMRFLFDLGLRRAELLAIDLADVDLDTCRVMIIGKGKREAEPLTMTPALCRAAAEWIDTRGTEPGPLFTSFNRNGIGDGRLTGRALARIINKLGVAAGIGNVSPHGLRHTAITAVLDGTNGNVRQARAFSRHASLETLRAYDDNRTDLGGEAAALISAAIDTPQLPL